MTRKTRRPDLRADDHGRSHEDETGGGFPRPSKTLLLVGILGLLGLCCLTGTLFLTPNVLTKLQDASRAKARRDVERLRQAAVEYQVQHDGQAPRSIDELDVTPALRKDPWGHPYTLELDAEAGVVVISLGSDGAPGGEGHAADLSSADDVPSE